MAAGTGILVTGADGQVGRALCSHLPGARFAGKTDLDVRDRDSLRRACEGMSVVVHLAALTNVDGCERDPELAHAINAEGTRNVVHAAGEAGGRVVYLSTDYVFDGTKPGEYVEDDDVRPLNVYGESKLAGEEAVRRVPGNLIVRTSWVFGEGSNFVRTIRKLAAERTELAVVADQRGRPTAATDLAAALAGLVEAGAAGTVHVAGGGAPCSWAELAEQVVALEGSGAKVRHVTSEEYAALAAEPPAPRPRNSTLSLQLLRDAWGIEMPAWERSLAAYLKAAA